MSELREILERHRADLMRIAGVQGVAIGRSSTGSEKLCIIVYATTSERPEGLPEAIEGYDVEVHKTSEFRAR